MNNFWQNLPKPFMALAPMADVTDPAFRRIIAKYGKPDVTWTEFVSADGLMSAGREVLKRDLEYSEGERPIVAQLFSSHPDRMRGAAKLCAELGFDGIDINMGCPDRSIEKQGAGAAMIKTPEIAGQIIQAVKDGIADAGKDIPVSVKTRVGYNQVQIKEWIPYLLSQNIDALTVHARTRKEMSKVPAHWEYVKEVVKIRDKMGLKTKILGNGDVRDIAHARQLASESGCDGVMIGRAIFGNPWLFSQGASSRSEYIPSKDTNNFLVKIFSSRAGRTVKGLWQKHILHSKKQDDSHKYWLHVENNIPVKERLEVMVEHMELFDQLLGDIKNFAIMKKHFKAYVNGFDGAKELRMKLMDCHSVPEARTIVAEFLKNL